jgi:tetratricopeptide (TPR) repeat protein
MRRIFGRCPLLAALLVVSLLVVMTIACTTKRGYVEKGNALFKEGRYEEAALNYQKAIQKDPKYGEAYYRLGLLAMSQNHYTDAFNALFRANQLLPNETQVKESFGAFCLDYYLKSPQRPQKLYQQTAQLASQLLAQNPNSVEGLRLKGALAHEDRKPDEAISYFRKALAVQPGNTQITAELAQTLFEQGNYPEGEKTALELISRSKTYGPIYDVLYNFYSMAGRATDAENIAKLKVANNPKRASYRIELAADYARVKNTAAMQATLQTLLDNPKDFPDAQLLVGDFYLAQNDYARAIQYYQAAEQTKDKAGAQKKALAAMLAGRKFDDATKLVDQILKESPNDELALRVRADLLINTGKPENGAVAVQILQAQLNANRNQRDPALRLNLGRAYRLKGDLGAARAEFEEALREHKDFPAAEYELGRVYLAQGKTAEAVQAANAAAALTPSNRRALLLQAWTQASTGQPDKARTILDQMLKQSPNDPLALYQRALISLRQGNFAEAVVTLQSIHRNSDPTISTALATAYVGLRDFDKAEATLTDALKQSPGSLPLQAELARTTALGGDYNLAIEEYQKVIRQDPKSAPFQLGLGQVYQVKGDLTDAVVAYQQAHKLAPDELTPALVLADTLATMGRNDEAKTLYHQIVRSHPDDPPALNNAAYFFSEHGEVDEAERLVERALQKVPGQPGFSDTLGYVYLKKGDHADAIRTFSDLVRRYPSMSVFHYHLGLALYQQGDQSGAKKELQRALASHPNPTLEPSIKVLLSKLG